MLNRVLCRSSLLRNLPKMNGAPKHRASHEWTYRQPPPPGPKHFQIAGDALGAFMWWWVLWHMWHDYGHIIGEFPYPDPSKWTDEELGILPEDE